MKKLSTRAIVLEPLLWAPSDISPARDINARLEEACGLAHAIGLIIIESALVNLRTIAPAFLFGKGTVANWGEKIKELNVQLAVIDHPLSPVQQRNLEKAWNCKVIDRTGLILEIFGARAHTSEGKLQVELAALIWHKSRLVRSWTHLERQRGGFGFLGGPGESQLEIDRRLITNRIVRIRDELRNVRRTRGLQRSARQRASLPTIALVGYTNAGKSTLFNRLTGASALAENKLFATLDPSLRGIKLPNGQRAVLSDTVGFISDLPTTLIEAFRATLEEVQQASLILHVRDASHPETGQQRASVLQVLSELGIPPHDKRLLEVINKSDLLPNDERQRLVMHAQRISGEARYAPALEDEEARAAGGEVVVSALTGDGIEELLYAIAAHLAPAIYEKTIKLKAQDGAALAWLYRHGEVASRITSPKSGAITLTVKMQDTQWNRFKEMGFTVYGEK